MIDLTERTRPEALLREKQEEHDHYFPSSLDLLCIADTGGHFLRLNQSNRPKLAGNPTPR